MRKSFVLICTFVFTVLLFASTSSAINFGLYADFGGGSGDGEFDLPWINEFDVDTDFFGIGFQLETNPLSASKLFSYRLQAGFESRNFKVEDSEDIELGGLLITNTFAFGKNLSEKSRLWAGPQILIGTYWGESEEEYIGDEISFSGFGFGYGIAGGANFDLGNGKAIVTTTIGWRAVSLSGEVEWHDLDEDADGDAKEFFLSVGLLF